MRDRIELVDKGIPELSMRKQCELLGVARSSVDYRRVAEDPEDIRVTRLLDEITAGPEYVIPLDYDGTYYTGELSPDVFDGRNRFYMIFATDEDPQTVLQALESFAKLGSRESLPLLIARSLPGIKLEHLPAPPQELPRRAGSIYFQIDHHSDYWAQVQEGHNIALFWDTAPADLKVELMIVGKN